VPAVVEPEPFAPAAAGEPLAAPGSPFGAPTISSLNEVWPAVLDTVRAENGLLAAIMATATPVAVTGDIVEIAFPKSEAFAHRKAEDQANRQIVAEALRAVVGSPLRPEFELRDEMPAVEELPPPSEDEWIARFKEAFDAEELTHEEEPR
jgi:hypothetical protein